MSSRRTGNALVRMIERMQIFKVLQDIVPQMFSNKKTLATGEFDEWKLSNITPRMLMSLIHFNYRGEVDKIRYYQMLVPLFQRGSISFNHLGRTELENIAIGMSAGGRNKTVRKTGVLERTFGGKGQYEEVGGNSSGDEV